MIGAITAEERDICHVEPVWERVEVRLRSAFRVAERER